MRRAALVLTLATVSVVACVYDDDVPDGARIFCDDDADCPRAGDVCDAVHLCRAPDGDVAGPARADVVASPAAATVDTRVTLAITADEPLSPDAPVVVAFAGGVVDPGFQLDDVEGARATLSFVVAADTPEGFYAPSSAALTDAAGNEGTVALAAGAGGAAGRFVVDRTPPLLTNVTITDERDDGVLLAADDASADEITIVVDTSEELASLEVTVGLGLALPCAPVSGLLKQRCVGDVVAELVQNGSNPIRIEGADAAGNEVDAAAQIDVDLLPPLVERAALLVDGRDDGAASSGSVIELEIIVDEDLLDDTIAVVLDTPDRVPFTLVERQGRVYELRALIDEVVVESAGVAVLATFADELGHGVVDLPLPLAPPFAGGVPLVAFPLSPCTESALCPDVDGDGFLGQAPACAAGQATDCDDADPFVFPGAWERPGDGVRNDCDPQLVDTELDESVAVFVAPDGDDLAPNAGTRAAPYQSPEPAFTLARASGRMVVLATGAYAYPAGIDFLDVPHLGGYVRSQSGSDVVWTRGGVRSTLDFACFGSINFISAAFQGIHINCPLDVNEEALLDDVVTDDFFFISSPAIARGLRAETSILIVSDAPGTRLLGSVADDTFDVSARNVHIIGSVADALLVNPGADVVFGNSGLTGSSSEPTLVACNQCGSVTIVGASLAGPADVGVRVTASTGEGPLISIADTIISLNADATIVDFADAARLRMHHNLIVEPAGAILAAPTADLVNDAAGVDALDDCLFDGCVEPTGDNVRGSVAFALGDVLHLADDSGPAVLAAGSPALDDGAPAEAVADVDGTCRYGAGGGAPNIGPDDT